jgi:hypothetical protein
LKNDEIEPRSRREIKLFGTDFLTYLLEMNIEATPRLEISRSMLVIFV